MIEETLTPLRVAVGHMIPGTIFLLIGLRHFYIIMMRHFLCLREAEVEGQNARKYKSTLTFPVTYFKSPAAEALILVALSCVGLIVEMSSYNPTGYAIHNTLYLTWGAAAAVEAMVRLKFPVPYGLEYLMIILAGFSNGVVVFSHSQTHSNFSRQCHRDLVGIIAISCLFVALEAKYRSSVLMAAVRGFCGVLIGTWWWSVGLLITHFVPSFASLGDDGMSISLLQVLFIAQIYIVLVICMIFAALIFLRVKFMSPQQVSIALDEQRMDGQEEKDTKYFYESEKSCHYQKISQCIKE